MPPALRPSDDTIARLRFEAEARSLPLAYLVWFFLGHGGVHRMYLGRWISGLVMLAIFGVSLLLIPGMVRGANNRLIDRLAR